MRVLILGGAGFVGSSLAKLFASCGVNIVVFDNLKRRGSELNIADFKALNIRFVHGDIRISQDLDDIEGDFDAVIDASAEPSVQAGLSGNPSYLVQTNLVGTINALEFVRKRACGLIFLSTSRVYSISSLLDLPLQETASRLSIDLTSVLPKGVSEHGISESFEVLKPRSLYGATKLASELLIQEYVSQYAIPAVINRCGVIAGPRQWGKTDQGVFALWVIRHLLGGSLTYTGFGGTGKQVRDLLHPADLFDLIRLQLQALATCQGGIFNVGGGIEGSVSLQEYTALCQSLTGKRIDIGSVATTHGVDIPYYVTDSRLCRSRWRWAPTRSVKTIVEDITAWVSDDRDRLAPFFL